MREQNGLFLSRIANSNVLSEQFQCSLHSISKVFLVLAKEIVNITLKIINKYESSQTKKRSGALPCSNSY